MTENQSKRPNVAAMPCVGISAGMASPALSISDWWPAASAGLSTIMVWVLQQVAGGMYAPNMEQGMTPDTEGGQSGTSLQKDKTAI